MNVYSYIVTAKTGNNPKVPQQMAVHPFSGTLLINKKKHAADTPTAWMNIGCILLRDGNQTHKVWCDSIYGTCWKRQTIGTENIINCQGLEVGRPKKFRGD